MAIEGPLRELGIHDVFQLLDLSRKTGTLTVTSVLRDNQGVVYFDRGAILHASIKSNPHRLGELLLRAGKITEGDVTRLREQQRREGNKRKLGELLVDAGALSRKELERQVRFQLEEVVFEMMSWREGHFSFEEGPVLDAPAEADIRISTESMLMEGARRIDEWSRIEGKVPNVAVIPVFAAVDGDHAGALDLLPREWEVLAQIDGGRDLKAIAAASAMSEFDVAKIIYGLVTTGIVDLRKGEGAVSEPPPAPPVPPRKTPRPRPAQPEEAIELPGSLLHVPSLEQTGIHRAAPPLGVPIISPDSPPPPASAAANAVAAETPSPAPAAASSPPAEKKEKPEKAEYVPTPRASRAIAPPPAPRPSAATPPITPRAEDALAHLERARSTLRMGAIEEAVEAAAAAVQASGGAVEASTVLARAQLKAGRVTDALATVRAALERDMLNPALYRLLGACAVARGELSDAVAGWERYLRLAPDDEHAEDAVHVRAAAEAAAKLRDALKELGDV